MHETRIARTQEHCPDITSTFAGASPHLCETQKHAPSTQTIQVLRDMMYRLCERYLNGAISTLEFEQQAARDQRLIVSVLAIEQLTGAVRAPRAGISSRSTFERGKDLMKSQELLTEATAKKNAAQKTLNALQEQRAPLEASIKSLMEEIEGANSEMAAVDVELPGLETKATASKAAFDTKDADYKKAKEISDAEGSTADQKAATAALLIEKNTAKSKSEADAKKVKDAKQRKEAAQTKATNATNNLTEKQNTLQESDAALADAQKTFDDLEANVITAQSIRDAADSAANSSSGTVSFEPGTISGSTISAETAKVLSGAVTQIVETTFDDDEFQRSCLSVINSVRQSDETSCQVEIGFITGKNISQTNSTQDGLSSEERLPITFQSSNFTNEDSLESKCLVYFENRSRQREKLKKLSLIVQMKNANIPDEIWHKLLD